jgi:hypothetical protein
MSYRGEVLLNDIYNLNPDYIFQWKRLLPSLYGFYPNA